ncbi:MAG TPA: c-type cytochrome [Acidisoma sp.]|jgi:cytochrome c553|uniref:c-type cytochrome n=1 Tax=Acidisoma sp. TaxID=1872115 RepID=UPI002BB90D40|nr:c-type cytochrome [Acidisoma sp.]HTI00735.1 c-type cytochrome [Acidisoma sp.]
MLHRLAFLAGLALVAAFPLAARAAGAPPQVPLCASCHGNGGISGSPTIPSLAGQKQGYLEAALADYKNHKRLGSSADMMTGIAAQLSAADMQALAAYYASLKGS